MGQDGWINIQKLESKSWPDHAIAKSARPREREEKERREGDATGRNGEDESGVTAPTNRVECEPLDGELKPHT